MLPQRVPTSPAIGGGTALVGVLGDPVRHSLSPRMHNAALAALGLDWVYLALPTPAERLAVVLEALEALDCRGLNVTLPHKQAVAALAAECSPLARRLGAVNTLVRRPGGGWFGTNTDGEGFVAPLRAAAASWQGRRAVLLGCGGSARAVVAGLTELGFASIAVAARRPAAAASFCADVAPWAAPLEPVAWPTAADPGALGGADLVVNTTPVGMASAADPATMERSPLEPGALEALPATATVYDLIYTPRPTRLLREAAQRGCATLDGLEMLVQQGAAALRLWSGRSDVPVAVMRNAALEHLTGRCP
ncbi:MAG: shikimate dehydrogenase [Synechococcus sp.]